MPEAETPHPLDALIPHRPPMRLIDAVLAWDAHQLWATVTITTNSPFAGPDGVPSLVGLEYLAQASAAMFSLLAPAEGAPRQGKLIACPRFEAQVPHFAPGGHLLVRVEQVSAMPDAGQGAGLVKFRGAISCLPFLPAPPLEPAAAAALQDSPQVQADFSVYV